MMKRLFLVLCLSGGARVIALETRTPMLVLRGGSLQHGPVAHVAKAYASALATAPLATNVATAATLSVIADGIAQRSTSSSTSRWDHSRSAWQFLWGAVVSGYFLSFWFALLARLFPDARTSLAQLVGKVCTNQLFMSPGLNGGFFAFVIFTRTPPCARMTPDKWLVLKAKWATDLLPTCIRSTAYWSVVQTLNFRVLPASATVLSTNLFFLVWTVYLSIVGNRDSSSSSSSAKGE